ncbi:MAG: S-adenosylmethionine:tRNA ribosyltransferase-isomerase, partial [Muribaculaceae bacterium]|nr:S-adenosylmethionine:tRNA ribosyltransferase-isomerase [Muribaculaceae bacterium]
APYPVIDTIDALTALKNYMIENSLPAITAATSIMIAPGFEWRIVDAMVTNFHQPQSTLLLLVSSFLERNLNNCPTQRWRKLYEEALSLDYRFLSYGDACLLFPLS